MNRSLAVAVLLTGTALSTPMLSSPAWSQAARPDTTPLGQGATLPTDIGRVRAGGEALPSGITRVDIGGGLMIEEDAPKSRSTVTRDYIAKQSPTANPYQLLQMLPGANVSSPDAFGLNGGNITVRGFDATQIGLTIDGAPVNDSGSYSLFPQEYVDAENIQQVVLSQGSPDLDSPHVGATGGVINIYTRDPSKTAGGYASFSYGSNNAHREFIRLETGEMATTRAFVSYSHFRNDHWRGPGNDDRSHFDLKTVTEWGRGNRISVSMIYNEGLNNNYLAPNLTQWQNQGTGFNTLGYFDKKAVTDPVTGVVSQGTTTYYKTRINPFRNLIASAPSSFPITDDLTLDVVPYVWYGYGNGGGTTAISESGFNFGNVSVSQDLNGNGQTKDKTLLFYSPSITETVRPGVISKLTYNVGNHKIVGGYWYEAANHHQFGAFTPLNADGSVANVYGDTNNLIITSGPYAGQKFQKRNQITLTRTNVFFLGDSITLLDNKMQVDVGIKQAFVSRHGQNLIPGTNPYVNIGDTETLPTAGVSYKLNDQNQVFASVATTFRTPANFVLFDSYSVTSTAANKGFGAANPSQKPEHAIHFEVGHRYQGPVVSTSVTAFAYHYQGRQLQTNIPDPSGGTALISTNINAGNTTTYGMDFEVGTRLMNNVRAYASAEFLRATLDGDIAATGILGGKTAVQDALPTKGKYVPQTPQMLAAIGIDYDDGSIFGNIAMKYIGKQWSTFTNDESIPEYGKVDATIGYRLKEFSYLKEPTLRLNLYNIVDTKYLSGVSSITSNAQATTGRKGSVIAASSPSYYVGQGFAAIVTLSSAF